MAAPPPFSDPPPPAYRGGSGEPLLLLHGGGGTWRLWEPALPHLAPAFDVLAPTLPGHWGGPPVPPGEATIVALADGVADAMDSAGWKTAHVAGGSLGSWVAFELARRGRARTVTAIAPAAGWTAGDLHWAAVAHLYRAMGRLTPLIAAHPERWSSRPGLRRLLAWHHFSRPERMTPDYFAWMLAGFANCTVGPELAAWALRSGTPALDGIACPVRLAFPEWDPVFPRARYEARLLERIPHADVVELLGAGHVAMSDDPAAVATAIMDFAALHPSRIARSTAGPITAA